MGTVGVNPPRTPVTKGSSGLAVATVPNICKMPGPPAPFVPAPLPNIGKSGDSPKGYTKKVKCDGDPVAIAGATFKSTGDVASKGTGGGLVSSNTHGPTKFVGPGSMDVKFEGKAVQLLGDPMLNNCGGSGSPPNSATMMGLVQGISVTYCLGAGDLDCPHPNMKRSDPNKDEKKRRNLEQDREKEANKGERLLRRAVVLDGQGKAALAGRMLDKAIEAERQSNAMAFEQKVADDTKAKEVSVDYSCPDCGMQGELDCITEDGTVKECKMSGAAVSASQMTKHASACAVLFPGAPVHAAVPAGQGGAVTPAVAAGSVQQH
ncbi:MAG: PAAR-like domain-containing protein [Nannocystales bacterium]